MREHTRGFRGKINRFIAASQNEVDNTVIKSKIVLFKN
jgi:hypothetical protein